MCTVRTPRNQVARTLRVQCLGRGRCYAHNRLVVRACALGRARCCAQLRLPRLDPKPRSCTKWPNRLGQVVTSRRPTQVETSKRGRDFVSPAKPQVRSRLHFQVATSWMTKPGRDANPMSRPPFSLNQSKPCRDLKMGSRPQWLVSPLRPQI